jgi:glutathione S-transferase
MKLVGMRDSPYVRRVAISMKLMGLPFEHERVSVFRHMDRFREINPVIKAPSFICDDGTVLMDSTLILDYLEHCVAAGNGLMPPGGEPRKAALRLIGISMAANEKNVAMVYEKDQRPPDKRHQPWLDRAVQQVHAAMGMLEEAVKGAKPWLGGERLNAADVAVAVAWRFCQHYNAAEIPASRYPALAAYSARAEALPEFAAVPLD